MKCKILYESGRRLRVHVCVKRMTMEQADILEYYLQRVQDVRDVRVSERTMDAVIKLRGSADNVKKALAIFSYESKDAVKPEYSGRELNRMYQEKITLKIAARAVNKIFFPFPLQQAITIVRSVRYAYKALKVIMERKIAVELLDATAIIASMLTGDFSTASSIMFLLGIGETLEEWTHKKSVDDLARTMSLNIDRVWLKTSDGEEVLVRVSEVRPGDRIVVHTGNLVPLDGIVSEGDAMVEQASITGEPLPAHKTHGSYVYAGSAVEEGDLVIEVKSGSGSGRYDRIVQMIEESEKLKSETESGAEHLADRLVPFSFAGMAVTWLLTRNVTKALSFIMVDFSCALKLAMPLAVLSAMREAGVNGITVKGGKFLEAVAAAETIVFDKTGTLTHASPSVAGVVAFDGQDADDMLRYAACLEEHFPHSMANAVVEEAKRKNISHREMHSKVEYVVAHGISSSIDGKRALIGSYHFVFEDEKCVIPRNEKKKFDSLPDSYSHLYFALGGRLSAVILIEDPLRKEARDVVRKLHESGISKVVMMTGDSEKTAAAVAKNVGVDEYFAEVLPEDKAAFIRKEHEEGRVVIMAGDGINDSPALSEADAGIAISGGAAIAREVADITIAADDLYALLTLRDLSTRLMKRINSNYRFIITFNSMLIALGLAGVLTNANSALLHNASTVYTGLHSMTPLLEDQDIRS